jgi:L-aminopeptidase/D-esterase-like protein
MIITNDIVDLECKVSKSSDSMVINLDDIRFACCEYIEGPVGITYIDFGKKGAKVYMDIRGGWPGYINTLSGKDKQFLDGICISGGSIMGLEAITGVIIERISSNKFKSWKGINGVTIYSRNLRKNKIYPDKNLGRFAYKNLSTKIYSGQVGAGLSAAKGQGVAYKKLSNGIKILVIVVNNAFGDIYKDNKKIIKNLEHSKARMGDQTTITTVITNLVMDNDELKQLSHQVNASIGKTIYPFNTFFDGDTFYACSTCTKKKTKNIDTHYMIGLYMQISDLTTKAILDSIPK